jgi:hypothetical protein
MPKLGRSEMSLARMSIGIKKAKGDIILILETDNIIQGKSWFTQMVTPFIDDNSIISTFSAHNSYESSMPILTKYYSLFGVNDTLLYYLHKSEKLPLFKDRYDKGRIVNTNKLYTTVIFDKKTLPTLGDNGHMVRRSVINRVNKKASDFLHTDAFYDLLGFGYNKYAAVNNSIIHYTGASMLDSFKKRITYKNNFRNRIRSYHVFDVSSLKDMISVMLFVFFTLTLIQPLFESIRGYIKKREVAWFLHPLMCLGTFASYTISVVVNGLKRE